MGGNAIVSFLSHFKNLLIKNIAEVPFVTTEQNLKPKYFDSFSSNF